MSSSDSSSLFGSWVTHNVCGEEGPLIRKVGLGAAFHHCHPLPIRGSKGAYLALGQSINSGITVPQTALLQMRPGLGYDPNIHLTLNRSG